MMDNQRLMRGTIKNFLLRAVPILGVLGTIKYYILVEFRYRAAAYLRNAKGVATTKRELELIVSMTSFGDRLNKVSLCIESLLEQSVQPDRIILWLSRSGSEVPNQLNRLRKRGLEIRLCPDIRSYTKIIYSLKEFPEAIIVTADDDIIYPPSWLEELYEEYKRFPQFIHCHRAHLIAVDSSGMPKSYRDWLIGSPGVVGPSIDLFPTGVGGVLYPPGALSHHVTDEETFSALCPTSDDIWLKAMSLLTSTLVKKVRPFHKEFIQIKGTQHCVLWRENILHGKNDESVRKVFDHFNLRLK